MPVSSVKNIHTIQAKEDHHRYYSKYFYLATLELIKVIRIH